MKAYLQKFKKTAPDVHVFLPFQKIAKEDEQIVEGLAVPVDTPDEEAGIWMGTKYAGDIIDRKALEEALEDYMKFANVREMHQPSAVGTTSLAKVDEVGLKVRVSVVDKAAWKKVKTEVYKGFSIGGKAIAAVLVKIGGIVYRKVTKMKLSEISLVDRPSYSDATFTLWKGDFSMPQNQEELAKAVGSPDKIVGMLQEFRNEAELAGDLDASQLWTSAIAMVMQAAGLSDDSGDEEKAPADGEQPVEGGDDPAAKTEAATTAKAAKTTDISKAGRTFSKKNADALHQVIKTMVGRLAATGDATALKMMKAYGEDYNMDKSQGTGDDLEKIIAKALKPLQDELVLLKAQPSSGGPAKRGQPEVSGSKEGEAAVSDMEKAKTLEAITNLRKRQADLMKSANTTSNPNLRKQYQASLAEVNQELAKLTV